MDKGRIALGVDPRNPDRVYAMVVAKGDNGGFFVSENAGQVWNRVSKYSGGDPQYYGEIFVDPHRPDTIWNVEVRVRRSTDGGRTWEPMGYPIHVDHHEIVFDESDPKHMWIGNDGGLYETYDGGNTWRRLESIPGLPEQSYVTDMFASRRNSDVVFATFNDWQRGDFRPWVLRSDDRGRTWTDITSDLPERSGAWAGTRRGWDV